MTWALPVRHGTSSNHWAWQNGNGRSSNHSLLWPGQRQPPLLTTHPAIRLNFEPAAQPVLLDRFALSCGVLALAWPRQSGFQRIPERIPCVSGVKQMLSAKLSEDAVAAWSTGRCIWKRFIASAWKHSKWNGGHIQTCKTNKHKRSYLIKVSLHAMFARHEQDIKNNICLDRYGGACWHSICGCLLMHSCGRFIVKKSKQECHPTVAWLSNQSRGPGWQSYLPCPIILSR